MNCFQAKTEIGSDPSFPHLENRFVIFQYKMVKTLPLKNNDNLTIKIHF